MTSTSSDERSALRSVRLPTFCLSCGWYETAEGVKAFDAHDCAAVDELSRAERQANIDAGLAEAKRRLQRVQQ